MRAAGGRQLLPELRIWRVPARALPSLRRAGLVLASEPDRALTRADGTTADAEPLAFAEWWRPTIGADAATPPGPGKAVTIVDSGLDITHEEFSARPNTTIMNTQTTSGPEDDHGTEVASVIGAPINGVGLVGVYPQALLRSWDASPLGFLSPGDAVEGISRAARLGPGVINLSFGGWLPDPFVQLAILFAFRKGSLVVASAGNDGLLGNPRSFPASYPHVLTVGATDESGQVAAFSSQSNGVDLVAPGVSIPVAEPRSDDPGGYITVAGTSFSAPMVSGAAAWVWTVRPELDNTQLFDIMRFSAHDVDQLGFDSATGFGLLDIPGALAFPAPPPDPLEPNDDINQVSPNGFFAGGQPTITSPRHDSASLTARVDRFEDPNDVYRVFVPAHRLITATTSGGSVDLRVYGSRAKRLAGKPAASSSKPGLAPDRVTLRNPAARGVYVYLDVRPDRATARTSYSLRVTTSARR